MTVTLPTHERASRTARRPVNHVPQSPAPPQLPVAPASPAPRRSGVGRDVFVDAVRAIGTISIVTVHWLMPEGAWDGVTLTVGNALGHGHAWVVTWVLQALPLMFFAAGAAAAYGNARRGPVAPGTWGATLVARLRGIVRPVAVFVTTWMATIVALLAAGVPGGAVWPLAAMAPQLLWFLAVWLVLLSASSALVRAWRRWRWRALAVAVILPLTVDAVRFVGGVEQVAWANVMLVWAVPFVAGIAYADDRITGRTCSALTRKMRRTWWQLLVLSVGAMVALMTLGPYPWSMIGMPGDAISNLAPPTAPAVAHAIAQVCMVLLAREAIVRWATGSGRSVVDWLARRSMTVYLWHLTAMFIVVGLVMVLSGEPLPAPWSAEWWDSRPTWFVAFGLTLSALVVIFGRFEGPRTRPTGTSTTARAQSAASTTDATRASALSQR